VNRALYQQAPCDERGLLGLIGEPQRVGASRERLVAMSPAHVGVRAPTEEARPLGWSELEGERFIRRRDERVPVAPLERRLCRKLEGGRFLANVAATDE
jgi:hypothetical protein